MGNAEHPVPKVASRADIAPFYVMEVMKAAAEREALTGDVLHLEVGQPSTGAPEGVLRETERLLRSGPLGYTDATGIPALRERIAASYGELYGVSVDPANVIVTTGASGAFSLTFLACFDAGDRVALLEPGYPCYRNALEAFGVDVVGLAVGPETRFQPTATMLETAGPLDGLVLASPSNPTGSALTAKELRAVSDWCRAHGVRLIADEIYHRLSYGHDTPTALSVWNDAVVINSFSKYYSMTGWRLGWIVAPDPLIGPIERLAQNLTISPPTLSQLVAIRAFECAKELDSHVRRYAANRDVLLAALPEAGMPQHAPADGAFYAYADTSRLSDDSSELCRSWLSDIGVAATPGIDFDPSRGRAWVRFSFAGSTGDVTAAAERLVEWHRRH
ncbi:MAG: aminotransferase class I/II-fold pyridoxal phosphate-dependent enzyme [Thermoleophilia bacterium]|nr:aminotransferase class I/II-fold pyridoxal phosphate-dependent enzyme [Thermoleophilia bacterium]MDH3725820.1 aminotransferase class I/II-fold pyridoxal phosphate-dependent enzyme [Thermoleophilia bacterium]